MKIFKPNIERLVRKKKIKGLIKASKHKDYDIRKQVAISLGELYELDLPEIKQCLLEMLGESFYDVVENSLRQFKVDKKELVIAYIDVLSKSCFGKSNALGKLVDLNDNSAANPILGVVLNEKNECIRKEAINALDKLNVEFEVEPLLHLFQSDPSYEIKSLIAGLLIKQNIDIFDTLIILLDSDNPENRILAADSLGRLSNKKAIDHLLRKLEIEESYASNSIRQALITLGIEKSSFIDVHILTLESKSVKIREESAQILGDSKDPRVIEHLQKHLNDFEGYIEYDAVDGSVYSTHYDPICIVALKSIRKIGTLDQFADGCRAVLINALYNKIYFNRDPSIPWHTIGEHHKLAFKEKEEVELVHYRLKSFINEIKGFYPDEYEKILKSYPELSEHLDLLDMKLNKKY